MASGVGVALGAATAGAQSSLAVQTDEATDVNSDGATLHLTLLEEDDAFSTDVFFEYGEAGSLDRTTETHSLLDPDTWSTTVSGLDPNTTYEYRAVAEGNEMVRGELRSFTTPDPNPRVTVTTDDPQSVSHSAAALYGSLDEAIDVSSVDVSFEWRQQGASSWTATRSETAEPTQSIRHYVDGLESGTTYEYRLTATTPEGATDTGSIVTVSTDASPSLKGTTDQPTEVGDTAAVLNGTLDELGDASSADVLFRWGPESASGDFPPNTTMETTLSSAGAHSAAIDGLDPATTYEYWIVLSGGQDVDRGAKVRFTTTALQLDVQLPSGFGVTDTSDTTATLQGEVTELAGADSVDVHFEYRESGTSGWSESGVQTLTSEGTFTEELTGLAEDTEHEFRAVADASDGASDTSDVATVTTTGDPSITTRDVQDVTDTSAVFSSSIPDAGGADSTTVFFEYGTGGDLSNAVTDVTSVNGGSFPSYIEGEATGLSPDTTYGFRAVVEASDGESDTGEVLEFTTLAEPPEPEFVVDTERPTDVTADSATLEGTIEGLGGADSADVNFEWREAGTDGQNETPTQTLASTGGFSAGIDVLLADTSYEFRATATASDGDVAASAWASFTTEEAVGNRAPVVDSLSGSATSTGNHAEVTADWSVSDPDGNLDTVTVEVWNGYFPEGSTSTGVGGDAASGSDTLTIEWGAGMTYEVRLTVTDDAGGSVTETRTVTAS